MTSNPTTTEPSVEDCLKELREMSPDQRVSVTETRRLLAFPDVNAEVDKEIDYAITVGKGLNAKRFMSAVLGEAMAQVRAWHTEQSKSQQ